MKKDSLGIPQGPVDNHSRRKEHVWIDGIEHKVCGRCQLPKPLLHFHADRGGRRWDGLRPDCRECIAEWSSAAEQEKRRRRVAEKVRTATLRGWAARTSK